MISLQGKSSSPDTQDSRREELELIKEKNKGVRLLEQHKEVAEVKRSSRMLTRDSKCSSASAEDRADLSLEDEMIRVWDGLGRLRRPGMGQG